jgi:hypothetical protein
MGSGERKQQAPAPLVLRRMHPVRGAWTVRRTGDAGGQADPPFLTRKACANI